MSVENGSRNSVARILALVIEVFRVVFKRRGHLFMGNLWRAE